MGCVTLPVMLIFCAIILIATIAVIVPSGGSNSITPSTVNREPLPRGSVVETGYYTDELGWIGNQTTLTTGMRNFYNKTGVQPYLYITDTIAGSHNPTDAQVETFMNQLYDELFRDEAHVLVVFFEYNEQYTTWYLCGTQAASVLDTEAMDILLDYIDRYYYYDNLNDEEFFSRAFNDAAGRIMSVTRSPWIPVLIVAGVLVLVIIAFMWWNKSRQQRNLEAEQTQQILNTPLETFGDQSVTDLEDKYKD